MPRRIITLTACAALFSGCGASGGSVGPQGWQRSADGSWVSPRSKNDVFTTSNAPFDGTLKDLASQTTTDIVLRNHATYLKGLPFARCPGEAGLQTFSAGRRGAQLLQVAFSVQNGRKMQATYLRSASEPDDPAAIDALAANVCVVP